MLVAVAVLGKAGFDYLVGLFKKALGRFFEKHGPWILVMLRRPSTWVGPVNRPYVMVRIGRPKPL